MSRQPVAPAWAAATRSALIGATVVWIAVIGAELRFGAWRNSANLLTAVLMTLALALISGGIALATRWLGRTPTRWLWAVLAATFALILGMMLGSPTTNLLTAAVVALAFSLLGGGWSAMRSTAIRRRWRVVAGIGFAASLVVVVGLIGMLWWDGTVDAPIVGAASLPSALVPPLALADPSAHGTFAVGTLTYGSGDDARRPEFGSEVTLRTKPFDGSRLVDRWKGRSGWARTRFFGRDVKHLPIQGRVYYPKGDGPFPLVLAVHGNHAMEDYSDRGYGYLGEMLASRGIVFASVDENFLNSSLSDLLGFPDAGLDEENDLRGVVLLEHLRAWRDLASTGGHPLSGRIDFDRLALIGHSRGGEAVSVAAAFNRLPFDPDDGRVTLGYGFNLRAVIAIAQVDGQYRPGHEGTPIHGVNYLALHGSYDGDVTTFEGARQWSRVDLGNDQFRVKSAVYVHGANHGQFNTSWGRDDAGGLRGRMLNLAAIMPADSQRRVAQVYISAFLEATLRDHWEYLPIFRDSRAAGAWLPSAIILTRLATSADRVICSYQEDIDLSTTSLSGGRATGAHLSDWREQRVSAKSGDQATRAVFLGWNTKEWPGDTASYAITLPDSGVATTATTELVFDLADTNDDPSPRDPDKKPAKSEKDSTKSESSKADSSKARPPIDLTVEVTDRAGHVGRLALGTVRKIQPQLEAKLDKLGFMKDQRSEIVFQSFALPLGSFPEIDPAMIRSIRFVFDRTAKGVIVMDQVALRDMAR